MAEPLAYKITAVNVQGEEISVYVSKGLRRETVKSMNEKLLQLIQKIYLKALFTTTKQKTNNRRFAPNDKMTRRQICGYSHKMVLLVR